MFLLSEAVKAEGPVWIKVLISILALFLIGALLGYGIEVLFRRFFSHNSKITGRF